MRVRGIGILVVLLVGGEPKSTSRAAGVVLTSFYVFGRSHLEIWVWAKAWDLVSIWVVEGAQWKGRELMEEGGDWDVSLLPLF